MLWALVIPQTFLNLRSVRRLRPDDQPAAAPFLSILIPARNERVAIEETVRAFMGQTYRRIEIIVVDDQSSDGTGEIVSVLSGQDPRVRLIEGAPTPEGWLGKPWALHQASEVARGDLLLFVDADVHYLKDAIASLLAISEQLRAEVVSVFPDLSMRGFWENVMLPQLAMVPYILFPTWLSHRITAENLGIGGGTGNLISRNAYDSMGGHHRLRRAVVDDVALTRLARRYGFQSYIVRADHLIRLRIYEGLKQIVVGFGKNSFAVLGNTILGVFVCCVLLIAFHLGPYALTALAVIEWIRGIPLTPPAIVGGATVLIITSLRLIVFRSLRYSMLSALFACPLSIAGWMFVIVRSAWVTSRGREVSWRGRTYRGSTAFGD